MKQVHVFSVVTCSTLSLANGQIQYNASLASNAEYPVDTLASFTCNHGYTISGSSLSICQPSGNWNHQPPICGESKVTLYSIFFT